MQIQLSEHFNTSKLIRFTLPSIAMMIFTSIYGVVDGLFVSNYAGKTPFTAVNLIMPFLMIWGGIAFMLGAGGSAVVSKTMGERDLPRARQYFSMLIYVTILSGVVFAAAGLAFLRPIAAALGAQGEILDYCVRYGRILLLALPAFLLQNVFQSFLVTAERPNLGLAVTVAAGVGNMVLDWLFVSPQMLGLGIEGAAMASALSQAVGGLIPLVYFMLPNKSPLRLVRARIDLRVLGKTCLNGSSEMLTNLSLSLVNMLYNFQLMKLVGEDGVAAYGVIMYINFIFIGVFIGYSMGVSPVVGFHYGACNHAELHGLLRRSLRLVGLGGLILTAAAELLAGGLASIFVGYDAALLAMTVRGFRVYSAAFLVLGFNIFGSAFFTALGNGLVSGIISVLRTLVFQIAAVLILPLVLGLDGVWLAMTAAETAALAVTAFFFVRKRETYRY